MIHDFVYIKFRFIPKSFYKPNLIQIFFMIGLTLISFNYPYVNSPKE